MSTNLLLPSISRRALLKGMTAASALVMPTGWSNAKRVAVAEAEGGGAHDGSRGPACV